MNTSRVDVFDTKWFVKHRGSITLSGRRWTDIKTRCLPGGYYQTKRPSYIGSVNDFPDFNTFVEWSRGQAGYDLLDDKGRLWQLDKDILQCGNKIYSESTCLFVPSEVNNFFISCDSARGIYPLGVTRERNCQTLIAQCQSGKGKQIKICGFRSEIEAHREWQRVKREVGSELVEKYAQVSPCLSSAIESRLLVLEDDYKNYRETLKL